MRNIVTIMIFYVNRCIRLTSLIILNFAHDIVILFFYESKNMTELHAIDTIPCKLVTRSSHPHIFSIIFENGKATHSLVTKLKKVSLWCTVGVMINIISIFRDYCINHQNILHKIFLEKLYFCKKIILIIIYFGIHYEFLFLHFSYLSTSFVTFK